MSAFRDLRSSVTTATQIGPGAEQAPKPDDGVVVSPSLQLYRLEERRRRTKLEKLHRVLYHDRLRSPLHSFVRYSHLLRLHFVLSLYIAPSCPPKRHLSYEVLSLCTFRFITVALLLYQIIVFQSPSIRHSLYRHSPHLFPGRCAVA